MLNPMQYHKTKNACGFMHPLSVFAEKFIVFSATASPVIDMGCAYGNITIAALEAGAESVIACDMAQEHLDILHEQLNNQYRKKLIIHLGHFPEAFEFSENSIGGIYASHLLEYLSDVEIEQGLEKFYRWLKPGGKLFLSCYTIYISELLNKHFQAEYQRRLDDNLAWPGYFEHYDDYTYASDGTLIPPDPSSFPSALHMFEKSILIRGLQKAGFSIEFAEYLDTQKECLEVIAVK